MSRKHGIQRKQLGHDHMMMIKRTIAKPEAEREYRSRGSAKRGFGLSDYQKQVMKQRREEMGVSQAELGRMIAQMEGLDEPIAQATISNLEKIDPRGRTPSQASRHLRTIEKILRLQAGFLEPHRIAASTLQPVLIPMPTPGEHEVETSVAEVDNYTKTAGAHDEPAATAVSAQELPIYRSTYGPDGVIIVSAEAVEYMQRPGRLASVRNGHGIRVSAGYGMEPLFEAGDVIFVNPNLSVVPNKYIALRRQEMGGEVLIRKLIAENATEWTVQQAFPEKIYSLPKAEWPIASRIIGKYYD
jgi:phage repressor protein C with HTH and peptisase S24 domain